MVIVDVVTDVVVDVVCDVVVDVVCDVVVDVDVVPIERNTHLLN